LHSAEDLTILHVVMAERPVGAGRPIPHNHLMWALIGVTYGVRRTNFSDALARPSNRRGVGG
jgi:predicted metal-dependent enzyme (double-stranded beta helix superfamily)